MWSLRRAAHPLRRQMCHCGDSRIVSAMSDIARNVIGDGASICNPISGRCFPQEFYYLPSVCEKFYLGSRSLCTQASARSSDEDDILGDGISEPEASATGEHNVEEKDGEELVSEAELSDDDVPEVSANDLDISDAVMGTNGDNSRTKKASLELFEVIISASGESIDSALQKWMEEGNSLDRPEISLAMLNLRKRRMYGKALQFLDWLQANKQLEFTERDYASRVDLIAKVHSIQKAEKYIEKIPEPFRGEVVYRTLLANCVSPINMKKAELVFNKMRELELPITVFACDQMILLYKRLDKKKIADVILLMEKENIKPSLFTYKLLIDTKGESNDIIGMEQLVKNMRAEGIEPDIQIQTILARHYSSGGLKGKAEAVLKDIEEASLKGNRGAHGVLLPLYASLGNADEVRRIWKVCELNPKINECMAAIEAWGELGRIEEAEAVFEKMLQTWKRLSSRHYSTLLNVFSHHKLVTKGKELVKRMGDSGCSVGPLTRDALVRLYVGAGEVEKADSILQEATQQNRKKPLFNSYMVVMDQYAKRGDVHNTEKLLFRMRQRGYTGRLKPYEVLLQAYINAKAPAYGVRERMKADNVFPNRSFAAQLARADPFKQTAVSDILD
uniref:Pentacotripeptide-repeat region of PRORP domain-containing protein n=1 Tax=Davidia involucrata TaxID=16924 RepID=A0A5B7BFB6_DAVIN